MRRYLESPDPEFKWEADPAGGVLAVTGGKGGTGKTTTTLGLAAAYARQRRRPTVVDADRDMPNLAIAADTAGVTGIDVVANRGGRPIDDLLPRHPRGPVLADCPAGAGPDAVTPLRRADRAVLVTTRDREAIEDAVKTAELARAVNTPIAGVVVTRHHTVPDGLTATLDTTTAVAIPERDPPLKNADATAAYDALAAALQPRRSPRE
ncbi:MinD/ParA family ATP-binding protein [Salarchaeum japonicum]|uniref:CobQ/CobB/MinD/ParA nucleotide binding domain-containing protein n=1 Tax=Salarchaeum japonicum TaxID=555573 RepID=A0AAV3SYP2_9EURY|nr:cell division inhibitor MinD [Salarchaeum japonicum]